MSFTAIEFAVAEIVEPPDDKGLLRRDEIDARRVHPIRFPNPWSDPPQRLLPDWPQLVAAVSSWDLGPEAAAARQQHGAVTWQSSSQLWRSLWARSRRGSCLESGQSNRRARQGVVTCRRLWQYLRSLTMGGRRCDLSGLYDKLLPIGRGSDPQAIVLVVRFSGRACNAVLEIGPLHPGIAVID
jgi:hypothetical protein